MVEIEHEVMDIEELFITGKDKKTRIVISIEDRGDFQAYITPVAYGQIKKLGRMEEEEIADYVLTHHFFKTNGETLTTNELELLPAGVLKSVTEKIMDISGMGITNEDIRVF